MGEDFSLVLAEGDPTRVREDFSLCVGEGPPLRMCGGLSLGVGEVAPLKMGEAFSLSVGESVASKVCGASVWLWVKAVLQQWVRTSVRVLVKQPL